MPLPTPPITRTAVVTGPDPAPTPANVHTPLVFWCNSQHTLLSPDRCSYSLLHLGFFRHRGSINEGGEFCHNRYFPLTGKMGMRPIALGCRRRHILSNQIHSD